MALSFEALGSEDVIMEEPPTRTRKRRVPDDAVDRELPASAPSASTAPAPPPVDTGYWQYLNRPSHPSPLGPFPTAGSSSPENGIVKMARLGVYILTLHPATAQQSGKMPQQLPSNYDPTLPVCSNCTTQTTPLWRRDESGSVLCNACALFQKMKGRPRPMSLKTDVIKQRNRVRKDKNAVDGDEADHVAKAKPKGKGKATQAPALKPHLAGPPADAQPWRQGTAEDRGTSRSRNPLRNPRKSAPGGADAAAADVTDEDGMEVDELEDDDDVDTSFNGYAPHHASLSPEGSSASNEAGDVGSVKRRRRRASEDVGDEAGLAAPPRAGAGQRRLSSANRRSSRSTSRARMPRSGSVDRVPAYAAIPPPGYAYPYVVPASPAAGARWMVPTGASSYHHYYTLPPGAPPHPSYPAGYAPYAPWQPAPAQAPAGYPVAPAPAPFGTSALRMSSSVDPHLGSGAAGAAGAQGYQSVRFAPAAVAQAPPSSANAGVKNGEPSTTSPPPPTVLRSASVDRPAGLRLGLTDEDEERGRRRARVTLPPLRAMIDGGGDGDQGNLPPRSGPPVSFEASAAAVAKRDASTHRPTVSSLEEPAHALRAASIVSSESSDSLSRGRAQPTAASGQTYSPGQVTTSTASLHRESPRFSSAPFGSIEEEPRMVIDEADGPTSGGLGSEAVSSSRRGRSETRKGTLSRGGSGGSTLGGSGERSGHANGSPGRQQHPSPSAFAGASPNRGFVHLAAARPSVSQTRNVSGLSTDSEELAHLRTRVAELEIINGFMESRIGQLEERSRSTSRSAGGSSGRGSSSRGISRGRGRGSGTGGGLPTPTSSRERAARAAATLEGKIAAASSVVSGPSTSSGGGGADDGMVSEEAEQEDEAVFAAELQKHGISGLDEGTRTAMLGLLRAKYGYRAGDLEPEPAA